MERFIENVRNLGAVSEFDAELWGWVLIGLLCTARMMCGCNFESEVWGEGLRLGMLILYFLSKQIVLLNREYTHNLVGYIVKDVDFIW